MTSRLFAIGIAAAGLAAPVLAADQPISASKLVIRRSSGGKEKLRFVSKDGAFLFPVFGSADDPAAGTPGGATIELFSQNEGISTFTVPAGAGRPGWLTRSSPRRSYRFTNPLAPGGISPVRAALLDLGRRLDVTARAAGLPLAGLQGAVGVRITTGSLRNCAFFDTATIRKDEAGVFLARDAVASALADCSNASLGGPTCAELGDAPACGGTCPSGSACGTQDLSTCTCIPAAQPCGGTFPVCNGECPVGLECGSVGGFPIPGCGCIPPGGTPCGETYTTCDGDCPTGLSCYANSIVLPIGTFSFCECLSAPPVDPCGGCPPGFFCATIPGGGGSVCYPIAQCDGPSGYPTCDGSCAPGATCQAIPGPVPEANFCVCVPD